MAEITASMVKELREMTGLAMMECKKALQESAGDLKKAEELLRIKSGAKASKAAGRIAAEGVIGQFVAADGKLGAMVEVNCETDFVARNPEFMQFAKALAQTVAQDNPADADALAKLSVNGANVEATRQALIQKIGENLSIRRFVRVTTGDKLAQYLHGGAKIGVLVEFAGGDDAVGKDIAMHVAASAAPGATRVACVSRDQVPAESIENERRIFAAQAAESGKPPEIVAKMVDGRIAKYLAEVTLLGQPFVKNPDETVEKFLKAKGATVKSFRLLVVGEGIEKRKDDFAAEVAAMTRS